MQSLAIDSDDYLFGDQSVRVSGKPSARPYCVPVLAQPADSATGISLTPTLKLESGGYRTIYQLQVSADEFFTEPLAVDILVACSAFISDNRRFWPGTPGIIGACAPPIIPAAATGQKSGNLQLSCTACAGTGIACQRRKLIQCNPTFNWTTDGDTSHLQVALDAGFTDVQVDVGGLKSTSYTYSGTNLNYSTTYHWRVRASNGAGSGAWSAVWNFLTTAPPPPDPPILSSPLNNAGSVSVFPTLQWISATGTYHIQIDNDSDCISPFINLDTLTQQKFTLRDKGLAFGQLHYWR